MYEYDIAGLGEVTKVEALSRLAGYLSNFEVLEVKTTGFLRAGRNPGVIKIVCPNAGL
jgi:hypothetical protein